MFVDKVRVVLKAGDGGNGAVSFRHEKYRARGGPDGGDGGDGGDIILRPSKNQNTLAAFRYKKLIKAEDGQAGSKRKRHGKSAADLEVAVPVGTAMTDNEGTIVADLVSEGENFVAAKGGKGGFGNAHFVSSTRQAPQVAEKGEPGEEIEVYLELKMIADIGIVGLPNAGKSTLLSVISNAKPEIANYPFTTLHPNLGVVDIGNNNSLLFADIPGLIEGASRGKGLGDDFLRHIERTTLLVHLIDVYNENITADYKTIRQELADYKIDLSQRPEVVVLTKIEGLDKSKLAAKIKAVQKVAGKNTTVMAISSSSGEGVKELLRAIHKQWQKSKPEPAEEILNEGLPVIHLKEDENAWAVEKTKGGFIVTGKKIEQFASRTKFEDYYGQQRLRDIMKKVGVLKELERQGIDPGQKITVGNPEIGSLNY